MKDAPIIWFGFEDYSFCDAALFGRVLVGEGIVDKLNLKIASEWSDISFVDLKHLLGLKMLISKNAELICNISLLIDQIVEDEKNIYHN